MQSCTDLRVEHCQCCGDATGKAGRADGSLFVDCSKGSIGPLCEQCYAESHGALLDAIYACLVAAGAPADIDASERIVRAAGNKPSDFVRQQVHLLADVLSLVAEWRARGRSAYSLPVIRGELLADLEARIEGTD